MSNDESRARNSILLLSNNHNRLHGIIKRSLHNQAGTYLKIRLESRGDVTVAGANVQKCAQLCGIASAIGNCETRVSFA